MKVLLLLACVAIATPLVSAGVGVVTPEVEAEAMRLWNQFCSGNNPEGGNDGDLAVFCKLSRDTYEESLQHEINVTPPSKSPQQVVFVRPPSYTYKHDVLVTGGGQSGQKTVIYVLPSKNKNEVNLVDNTSNQVVTQKPTVYFLKKDHGGEGHKQSEEIGAEPAPPPAGGYLPPPPAKQPDNGYNYNAPSRGLRYQ